MRRTSSEHGERRPVYACVRKILATMVASVLRYGTVSVRHRLVNAYLALRGRPPRYRHRQYFLVGEAGPEAFTILLDPYLERLR